MNLLPPALAMPIVAALNHLIAQEPWARTLLAPFADRVVRFDADAFDLSLRIEAQGHVVLAAPATATGSDAPLPDVTLTVPVRQWPLVVADVAGGGQAAAMKHVRIEGDAELANAVSTLARHLRWDAAEDLSRALRGAMGGPASDSVAQRVVEGVQQMHAQATRMGRTLVDNVTEYLLDERQVLVRHAALDEFNAGVSALRDDLARLEKRLERLDRLGRGGTAPPAPLPSAHR